MGQESLLRRGVGAFNTGVVALTNAPVIGKLLGKAFTQITYTGRRSGRTFSTPVNYRRSGDEYLIGVAMPDKKQWWRNFLGAGGPVSLRIDGVDRSGHAVAQRDPNGRVTVRVHLDASA